MIKKIRFWVFIVAIISLFGTASYIQHKHANNISKYTDTTKQQ